MKLHKHGFAIAWFGLFLSSTCHAVPFSEVYVFGDSLSDQGNDYLVTGGAVPPPEYSDGDTFGRFTNGENYIDYLSESIGVPVSPWLAGGTNYAHGGARTDYRAPTSPFALSLLEQRDAYVAGLGGGGVDRDALYVVWGGANDLGDIVARAFGDPAYDPRGDLARVAANIADVVASLAVLGAPRVVVPNVPDLGLIPLITGGGPPNEAVSALVANFNLGLDTALSGVDVAVPGLELVRIDTFALLDEVYSDPVAFGLSNVRDGCYSLYVRPGGSTCASPDTYLYWDLEHPSSATHRIFAAQVRRAVVPAPGSLVLTGFGLVLLLAGAARQSGRV